MNIAVPGNYVVVQPDANGAVTVFVTEPPPEIIGLGSGNVKVDPNTTLMAVQNTIAMLQSLAQQL